MTHLYGRTNISLPDICSLYHPVNIPPQMPTPFLSSRQLSSSLLPSLNLISLSCGTPTYVIKPVFSPVNLPYVNLIIRSIKEPKLVEENIFLLKGSNTLTQISGFKFSLYSTCSSVDIFWVTAEHPYLTSHTFSNMLSPIPTRLKTNTLLLA